MLTSHDLFELTENRLDQDTLDRWVKSGAVTCYRMATGNGKGYRLFDLMPSVAIVYAANIRQLEVGAAWIAETLRWIQAQNPKTLVNSFAVGRTLLFPIPEHLGYTRLMMPAPLPDGATEQMRRADELLNLEVAFNCAVKATDRCWKVTTGANNDYR